MMRLFDLLFPPREDELRVRKTSTEELQTDMNARVVPSTRPATTALLPFEDVRVRAAIHEAKYHDNPHAHRLLASALQAYMRTEKVDATGCVVIPIPLARSRHKKRGFNQVERIALRVPLPLTIDTTLLIRTRETRSQVSLTRIEREANMKDAFSVVRTLNPEKIYILLDDVLTTGATLQAGIDALRAAGAQNILPIAFAH